MSSYAFRYLATQEPVSVWRTTRGSVLAKNLHPNMDQVFVKKNPAWYPLKSMGEPPDPFGTFDFWIFKHLDFSGI
jgi:hypothetical protein